jgi:hypothetical protein
MKKITILFTLFVLVAALTTSCNKKKLDELEESNAAIKAQNDAIQAQLNGVINADMGTPINVSFTGNRYIDSAAFSFSKSFSGLDAGDYGNNYVYDNGDGTYEIYVYRYTNEGWAYIYFSQYDPTDDSYSYYYVESEGTYLQSDNSALYLYSWGDGQWSNNAVLNSVNYTPSNGMFDVNITVTTPDGSTDNSTENPSTTVYSFSGALYNDVYKTAAPARKVGK